MMTSICPRLLNLINEFVLLRFRARAPDDLSAIEVIFFIIIIIRIIIIIIIIMHIVHVYWGVVYNHHIVFAMFIVASVVVLVVFLSIILLYVPCSYLVLGYICLVCPGVLSSGFVIGCVFF